MAACRRTWRLKRTAQCAKCPWIKGTDPRQIPNGYDVEKHKALISTIAEPGAVDPFAPINVFACHETDEAYCVGWLSNQLGAGNNIGLRLRMLDCENVGRLRLRGEQHERFEDTLPEGA